MDIVLYGLNHVTAPIAVRERLSYKPDEASEFMSSLLKSGVFAENLLVSTCNRTEFYGITDSADDSFTRLEEILEGNNGFKYGSINSYAYRCQNIKAVQHLFSVASGLDSMVVGENEILGQLKSAYRDATGVDATGPFLNKLFHQAFRVGKLVRNKTRISAGRISVGSIAVELAIRVLGNLEDKKVLVIGAGDTSKLIASSLSLAGVGEFAISNRTLSKAEELADHVGGRVIPFESYPDEINNFNVVLTAVGVPGTIKKEMLRRIRGHYPLMIDLGVPRDIDEQVDRMSGAIVYHVDDLQGFVKEKLKRRESEIPKAKKIIDSETALFIGWWESLRSSKTISDLQSRVQNHRDAILGKWKGKVGNGEYEVVEKITGELVNKILHDPIQTLKGCELEAKSRDCDICDMFEKDEGPCHGSYNSELKNVIARMLFGLEEKDGNE